MAKVITSDERLVHMEQMLQSLVTAQSETDDNVRKMFMEIDLLRAKMEERREQGPLVSQQIQDNFARFDEMMMRMS